MKIGIGADHGGFKLKQELIWHYADLGIVLIDYGTKSEEACDYSDVANPLSEDIVNGKIDAGILICGAGIGMDIAANRHKGVRAGLLYSAFAAEMGRKHNDINVAVFGGRTMSFQDAAARFDIFLATKFESGRHERRIEKLDR